MSDNKIKKIQFTRVTVSRQSTAECVKNFQEVYFNYSADQAIQEAQRCLHCKHQPCRQGCPANLNIPKFIESLSQGDMQGALAIIYETHFFPSICGRVCAQRDQCEKQCVLGKKGDAISIGHLEKFVGDWALEHGLLTWLDSSSSDMHRDKKIAIIGSGPAGLMAASELAHAGFSVTIFEGRKEIGGILTYGIPAFRLPKSIIQHIKTFLLNRGVNIITSFLIGQSATLDDLLHKQGFNAIFLGSGMGDPLSLNILGENCQCVYTAQEYLMQLYEKQQGVFTQDSVLLKGKTAVVIGGGNVAIDAARSALRLGHKRVMIVYRRREEDMPARKDELQRAKEEGIELLCLCSPVEIMQDEQGRVKAIRCVRTEVGEFEIACEVVIVAIGNQPNLLLHHTTPDLNISPKGAVVVDDQGHTSKPFVYAAGDVVKGSSTVIFALKTAKQVAQTIMKDLLNNL
jgi:glutamate synthase (NADPH) small chain